MEFLLIAVLSLAQIMALRLIIKELDELKTRVKALEPQEDTEKENDESCGL